jgi:hypothetical protein
VERPLPAMAALLGGLTDFATVHPTGPAFVFLLGRITGVLAAVLSDVGETREIVPCYSSERRLWL